ncbi:MAG TPA: O-antigen ligase family protein [Thermoanaerobaculia bacterium]|nr:O-antigen ligase family protein [Thermoanaerobaculia bacterium]
MPSTRGTTTAERGCLTLFFVWLAWLPLPFGSNVPSARLPLIAVPLLLCAIAAAIRLYATRDRSTSIEPTRAWLIWGNGALIFLLAGALQLIPLPNELHQALSPDSYAIRTSAARIASLAGVSGASTFPLTVDPRATSLELFRLAAIVATFITAALLIRSRARRVSLAMVLCASAAFQALYGVREAALQRYEIWGWTNKLIFNRVTGTFVNPNHFAHYLAIVLPLALFVMAAAWRLAGPRELPLGRRLLSLLEQHILTAGFALFAAVSCVTGILLAQSRGTLLSLGAGVLAVAAMLPGRRIARVAFSAAAGLVLFSALVLFLGPERTVGRFIPNEFERQTLVGRRIGIESAIALWQRFSVFGTGLGTFERMVSMEQKQDLGKIYHHAHNDYAEIGATGGTLGFTIAVVTLLGGYVALVRMTFGAAAQELSWGRRAFQAAVLASLTIAMVHALFDFNFFIPSNPPTLAAMCGAAVASLNHDRRARR